MTLHGGKKWVRSGEREIVYNVHTFVKMECEVGITNKKCRRGSLKQHVLTGELYM
jgi:hypothetical protein